MEEEPSEEQKLSKNQLKKLGKNKKPKMSAEEKAKLKKDKAVETAVKVDEPSYVNITPKGEKKSIESFEFGFSRSAVLEGSIASSYDPTAVESAWGDWWERKGFFQCDVEKAKSRSPEEKFVMVIPPPNVTGTLHIGHGLTIAIEDTLVRWHRMKGHSTLWVPGIDHAGIATQVVVEKTLMKEEGKTRHDLGRDAFVSKVWEWKEKYGGTIQQQLRRLGASVDWSRETFTMDSKLSSAVQETFIRMFNGGKIYRGSRLVNWSCALKTAISDIEVNNVDLEKPTMLSVPNHKSKKYEFGTLTYFMYPVEGFENKALDPVPDHVDGIAFSLSTPLAEATLKELIQKNIASGERIVIATTRLETMLGDTAVAVHPDDPRYQHLHGKNVIHPFSGRKIPIICDDILVDMNFGTGAVKITPSHDENDFNCGLRHNLPFINILTDDGKINEVGCQFTGMMRFDARFAIGKELSKRGLLLGKEPNKMVIPVCSRSGDIIEPMLKPQWYVSCKEIAARSYASVQNKELKIIPSYHEAVWYKWMNPETIRDWCISRQLWWGHRIPAYLIIENGSSGSSASASASASAEKWCVGRTEEEAQQDAVQRHHIAAGSFTLKQDEDVLDTWFSSGLFPFSVFGWPSPSSDLSTFYPNAMLETGHDILFFWVARMVMMGLEMTDRLPFTTVYLHAMIRDKFGRKMSKSLGNVVDPLEVIDGATLEELLEKLSNGNLDATEIEKAKKGKIADFPNGIKRCGADALRFGLLAYTCQGRDINLDINRIIGYRNFCNKIWNAIRFSLTNLDGFTPDPSFEESVNGVRSVLKMCDRWILSKLHSACEQMNKCISEFDFSSATTVIYNFWLYQLCDVYLELLKPVMKVPEGTTPSSEFLRDKEVSQKVLYLCIEYGLRLLHPLMPYVTEELWQRLSGRSVQPDVESIMLSSYPESDSSYIDLETDKYMSVLNDVVHYCRSLESLFKVQGGAGSKEGSSYYLTTSSDTMKAYLTPEFAEYARILSKGKSLELCESPSGTKCGEHVTKDLLRIQMALDLTSGLEAIEKKLCTDLSQTQDQLEKAVSSTQIDGYEDKVPAPVREETNTKVSGVRCAAFPLIQIQTLTERAQMLQEAIENIRS